MPDWNLDDVFNEYYLELCEKSFTSELTAAQCDLIVKLLNIAETHTLLDICCGPGRHAIEFVRRGFSVIGVDCSEKFIKLAKKQETDKIKFICANANKIPIPSDSVDRAYCYYTSFGYGSEAEDIAILKEVHRCLKNTGRFLVEMNSGSTVRNQERPVEFITQFPNGQIVETSEFNKSNGRSYSTRKYETHDRSPLTVSYTVRLYTKNELTALFKKAGYKNIVNFSEKGEPFRETDKRLIVAGTK